MNKYQKNLQKINLEGQVMLEFIFSMIIILLMIFGTMMVFRWTGLDLAERRIAHDSLLTSPTIGSYGDCIVFDTVFPFPCIQWSTAADGPLKQIDPFFYRPIKMNAVFGDR